MDLGEKIEDLRVHQARLKQRDVARRLKISERTYRNWVKDPERITVGYLYCIAGVLNTEVKNLFEE